jgi:hypothetical protein
MTGSEAVTQLGEIKPQEWEKLDELVSRVRSESQQPLEATSQMWVSGSEGRAKPKAVLNALEELAIAPWLSASQAVAGQRRLEAVGEACSTYLAFQQKIVEKLATMLDSKTRVPEVPMAGPVEEKDPPSRECDEGYLLSRRLLKADESEAMNEYIRRNFLDQTEAEADAAINRYRKTGQWVELVEQDELRDL